MELYSVTAMAMMENVDNIFYRKRPKKLRMRKYNSSDKANSLWIHKLRLLLWKNLLLQKRHWVITTLEILLPTLIAVLFACLHTVTPDEESRSVLTDTIYEVNTEETLVQEFSSFRKKGILGYVPHNNLTEMIMTEVQSKSNKKLQFMPFGSEAELEDFATKAELESLGNHLNHRVPKVVGAVVFGPSFDSGDIRKFGSANGHTKIEYIIRLASYSLKTEKLADKIQFPGPSDDNAYSYKNSKFSGLQILLDKILIKLLTNQTVPYDFNQQVFPYPAYKRSKGFVELLAAVVLPMFVIIEFVFIVPSVVVKVVSEKETGIKELMRIMGLPNWINWLGWMLNSLVILTISVTKIVFLFSYTFNTATGPFLLYSNPTVWWFVLMLYAISATSFCFFISVFFDQGSLATAVGVVGWLLSYLIVGIFMDEESVTFYQKLVSCFLPNMALHWAIQIMFVFETRGVGAKWSTLFTPASFVNGLALHHVLIMFCINTLFYLTLTVYLENVLPSKFGISRPWNYPFSFSSHLASKRDVRLPEPTSPVSKPQNEFEPTTLPCRISVQDLSKRFDSKVVLKSVSLNAFEGQITALVGFNGGGKTTLLSILTGSIPLSSGTATVGTFDVQSELDDVRKSLGLCTQENTLFDKLTVWEHLILFGRLKGLNVKDAKSDANILIAKLHLTKKRSCLSCHLSGGQKRKLSLAMALIGGPEVLILDECTSGMDPESRRLVWDLLLEIRKERTILMSTHLMEEADVLGDRVAIMSDGEVKCCGSPMFLKKHFGSFYTLKLTTTEQSQSETHRITNAVQSLIPETSVTSERLRSVNESTFSIETSPNSSELAFSIPQDKVTPNLLSRLFGTLTQRKEELGILTMNIALPSLDEVLSKFGPKLTDEPNYPQNVVLSVSEDHPAESPKTFGSTHPIFLQLFGLLYKKFIYSINTRKLLLCQLVFPPILLITAILIVNYFLLPAPSAPPLKLNMNMFKNSITLYSTDNQTHELGKVYEKLAGTSSHSVEIPTKNSSLVNSLLEISKTHLGSYRDQYIIAAELNATSLTAMYNSIPLHSAPASLNLISNAVLRHLSPPNKSFSLEISNHPLQNNLFRTLENALTNPKFTFLVPLTFGMLVPFGLALLSATFVVFPAQERLSKFKHLQLMTGTHPLVFWATSFLWDFLIVFLSVSCVLILCVLIFESRHVLSGDNYEGIGVLALILLGYGYSTISFSYLASLFVTSASGGFASVAVFHLISGIFLPIGTLLIDEWNLTSRLIYVRYFLRLFSSYPTTLSIMRLSSIASNNSRCTVLSESDKLLICDPKYLLSPKLRQCCDNCLDFANSSSIEETCLSPEPFLAKTFSFPGIFDVTLRTIPGIAEELQWVFIMGLVYQLLIVLIESKLLQMLWNVLRSKISFLQSLEPNKEDVVSEDVETEGQRVARMTEGNTRKDAFVVHKVKKTYGDFVAVNNLSFAVGQGECFGLLGVNGAGKTATFRMLTGDESLSSGNAFALLNSLQDERRSYSRNIGYCPQFDALIGVLSGRQTLTFFAYLRGCPPNQISNEVSKWLQKLGLESVADQPCETYSGGTKRRLNVAVAMICDPPIVLLDEPTSGVDPVSRLQFLRVIREAKSGGQSVVFTSHSLNEVEDLCTRMGIMVNGQFACIGTAEHLRNKFATGFTITLRLAENEHQKTPQVSFLKTSMETKFDNISLHHEHLNYLQYHLKDANLQWDVIYRTLEDILKLPFPVMAKQNSENANSYVASFGSELPADTSFGTLATLVEDYSVSLTSLEDVFLAFARKQRA